MSRCLAIRVVLAGALVVAAAAAACAHAFLDHAEPAIGATIAAPPGAVRIWFSEALEPAFSTIAVTDAQGRDVARGKAAVDASDRKLLAVALAPLAPGVYRVRWRVVSVDSHPTEGDFTFTVKP